MEKLYTSGYRNIEYCFYEDHMTIDGVSIPYREMSDISHEEGDMPAFAFTQGDRRITVPYEHEDRRELAKMFLMAQKIASDTATEEPTPQTEEYVAEPETQAIYEEQTEEPALQAEEYVEEPATEAVPQAEEYVEEPATEAAPQAEEHVEEPATEAAPQTEPAAEPEVVQAQEAKETQTTEQAAAKNSGLADSIKAMSQKNKIIIAAIIAAIIIAIIICAIVFSGKSVEGINERVKAKTVKTETGDKYKIAVINDDVDAGEFSLDYYDKLFKGDDKTHWIVNKKNKETYMLSQHDGTLLICRFEYVEGEEEDSTKLGSGEMKDTWIAYPNSGEINKL